MEEISWGQRLFGYRPPAYFLERNSHMEYGAEGKVYEDTERGGTIDDCRYYETTPDVDWIIRRKLNTLIDQRYPYRLLNANCQSWSQTQFDLIARELEKHGKGVPGNPPPRRQPRPTRLNVFGEGFGIAPTRFQPSDRINNELRLKGVLILDDVWEAVDALLAAEFDQSFEWSRDWHTIDDMIRGLAKQVR